MLEFLFHRHYTTCNEEYFKVKNKKNEANSSWEIISCASDFLAPPPSYIGIL